MHLDVLDHDGRESTCKIGLELGKLHRFAKSSRVPSSTCTKLTPHGPESFGSHHMPSRRQYSRNHAIHSLESCSAADCKQTRRVAWSGTSHTTTTANANSTVSGFDNDRFHMGPITEQQSIGRSVRTESPDAVIYDLPRHCMQPRKVDINLDARGTHHHTMHISNNRRYASMHRFHFQSLAVRLQLIPITPAEKETTNNVLRLQRRWRRLVRRW